MEEVRDRGVWLAEGHGAEPGDLEPALGREIRMLYAEPCGRPWRARGSASRPSTSC